MGWSIIDWELEEKRLCEIRKKWYSLSFIKYLITEQTKGRELAFLMKFPKEEIYKNRPRSAVRYLQCAHHSFLEKHFSAFGFLNKPFFNMYYSISSLNNLPVFSYNLRTRSKDDEYIDFNENYHKHIIGYDIFFDIDNLDLKKAHEDGILLKELLDGYRVPYSISFSGSKGFHFKVPCAYLPKQDDWVDFIKKIANVIYNVKVIYEINSIDASITDPKRVCKLHYSLDRDRVVLPLSDSQFKNFDVGMVDVDTVLKSVRLMNRGDLLRTHGLKDSELKKNVNFFIKEHL